MVEPAPRELASDVPILSVRLALGGCTVSHARLPGVAARCGGTGFEPRRRSTAGVSTPSSSPIGVDLSAAGFFNPAWRSHHSVARAFPLLLRRRVDLVGTR